ncbi:MAG: hypothetical protein WHV44_03465 [Anaerolineales bacterium]
MKRRLFVASFQVIFWLLAILTMYSMWDKWMLDGPHGPYRWMGMDFAPFYVGVQEMFSGADPYSAETTLKIQEVVYGGPANGEDPMMFVYPAWLFLIIAPFTALPLPWAVSIYSGTLAWALVNLFLNLANQWGAGKSRYVRIFWVLVLTLGSLPFLVISVTKGQLGYLSLLALWAAAKIWDRSPFWAGVVLGLAIIKPTVTVIPTAGYLLWALHERNGKMLAGFVSVMTLLFFSSILAVGNWLPGYVQMLSITGGMPVIWSLAALPTVLRTLYLAGFLALILAAGWTSLRTKDRQFWLAATTLSGIATFPMRWIYDLFLGILIPAHQKFMQPWLSGLTTLAILAPWALVFLPNALRANTIIIGLPLLWATVMTAILVKNWKHTHNETSTTP